MIKAISQLRQSAPTFSTYNFHNELRNRLEGRRLHINRETMNMKSLEILIKHGLKMEDELLGPLRNAIETAKLQNEKKREKKKEMKQIRILKLFQI